MPFVLAILIVLAVPAPAMAAEWNVDVSDFSFTPEETRIEVGDRVVWRFLQPGHTTTSEAGQAESWDSGFTMADATYSRIFTRPGRFTYVCTPHAGFMKGAIQVGDPPATPMLAAVRTTRRGRRVTISFRLGVAARVSYRLRGPSRRRVRRGRLAPGEHSIRLRRLSRGRYRGTLMVVDDFGEQVARRNRFRIR